MQAEKVGHCRLSITTDQLPSSESMVDMIKEGVAHGEMGGDGMQEEKRRRGSLERAPGKPEERCLQSVDSLTLSVE